MSETKFLLLTLGLPFLLLVVPLGLLNEYVWMLPTAPAALLGGSAQILGYILTSYLLDK